MEFFKGLTRKHLPRKKGYEYFKEKDERHDIYEFSKELTKYVHDNKIRDVILIDRSARPAWVGIDEYWKNNYPDEKRPGIHFINPEPMDLENFFRHEKVGRIQILKDLEEVDRTGTSPLAKKFKERIKELAEDFVNRYKISTENPVLLFDTCSHTGDTIRAVGSMLQEAGYDLRVITANDSHSLTMDQRIDMNAKLNYCYPFGIDSGVEKSLTNITSSRDITANTERVAASRRDIRKIIKNRGK